MTEARLVTREQLAAAIEDRIDLPAVIKPEFVATFVDTMWPALPAAASADAVSFDSSGTPTFVVPAAAPAEGLREARLRAAIAYAGFEFRDPCDACGGVPDPREPDVICAWCGGINGRLIRSALARHERAERVASGSAAQSAGSE